MARVHPSVKAAKKASRATQLFADAKTEVEQANAILAESIAADKAEVDRLIETVNASVGQYDQNEALIAKLADLVA